MSVVKTVNKPDQFLIQVNGSVRVPFDEISITVATELAAGTVLEDAGTVVDNESAAVLGILAEDKGEGTVICRVMTRGNPSIVNEQDLGYGTADSATINPLLEAKGILVRNS